jgi:starch-binding outer membrane protein, SusD/RagB family
MTATLNALRASAQNLGAVTTPVMTPLAVPASHDAAIDQYFREKAFWTFGRGQRLGALRRLVRQYQRTQDQVFPTGNFFKGATYGTDVNFPATVDEQNNPEYKGCSNRAA